MVGSGRTPLISRSLLGLFVAVLASACAGPGTTPRPSTAVAIPPASSAAPSTAPPASAVVPSIAPSPVAVTADPTASPPPSPVASSPPTAAAQVTRTYQLNVQQPSVTKIAPQDKLDRKANGGIVVTTHRDSDHPLHLEWLFEPARLPAGSTASHVESRVCGHGEGDFYEVYGPYDSDPVEYEVKPPAADGCWHFSGRPSDWIISIYVYGDATLTIDRIEMDVTTDR
jgi:hypothetical protein